jgi:hypothetical protein
MELIEQITLGSAQSSITFSAIPQTYTDLLIVHSIRSSRSATVDNLRLNINAQGVNVNITCRALFGDGQNTASDTLNTRAGGLISAANATASTFGNGYIYFPNYTSSVAKSISTDCVSEDNATNAFQSLVASLWNQTAAINSISLDPANGDCVQHSSVTLYGITAGSDGIVSVS